MPPIARLTPQQARYHFLSGFTARLAGTEIGVTEPAPAFSPCFGGPFLPQPPAVYARLLGEKLHEHQPDGVARQHGLDRRPAGEGGHRMPIAATRALLQRRSRARSTGSRCASTPCSASRCRSRCPGVDTGLLDPRSTWPTRRRTTRKARELAGMFRENFERSRTSTPRSPPPGPCSECAQPPGVPLGSAAWTRRTTSS